MATNNMTKDNRKEGSKPKRGGAGGRQTRQTNKALCEKLLHFKKLWKIDSNFIALLCAAAASRGRSRQAKRRGCCLRR